TFTPPPSAAPSEIRAQLTITIRIGPKHTSAPPRPPPTAPPVPHGLQVRFSASPTQHRAENTPGLHRITQASTRSPHGRHYLRPLRKTDRRPQPRDRP